MRGAFTGIVLLGLVAACAPGASGGVGATSTPTVGATPAKSEIRFGLIGSLTKANVWALFDQQGYSYNNYAVRSGYWPRLYGLSVGDRQLNPLAAQTAPSEVRKEGAAFTATVPLRPDLRWSDGSPFTAEDVAFTVNSVLQFHLGFDWKDYYSSEWLDHAEAADPHAVKFFFSRAPDVGIWQYGVLQGPVVDSQYWAPRVAAAAALLPAPDLLARIEALELKIADLEGRVSALNAAAVTATGEAVRQVQANLRRQQGDLNQANNELTKAQAESDRALDAARAALYALDDGDEPRLGAWKSISSETEDDAGTVAVNDVNPNFPGPVAHFSRASYHTYPRRDAALASLLRGETDVVLDPAGAPSDSSAFSLLVSPTRSVRFLVFNLSTDALHHAALRQALACLVDQTTLAGLLDGRAAPLVSFVEPEESAWYYPDATLPCSGLGADARLEQAIHILKVNGYTWTQEPTLESQGQGLAFSNGRPVPDLQLLTDASDEGRTTAAAYIQQEARRLGIPLTAQEMGSDTIEYAVFSSHHYDLALLGWRLSAYPGYLCSWFGAGGPFQYDSSRLISLCSDLETTSELAAARGQLREMQLILAQDVPMIPLYAGVAHDTYRNVAYPFTAVLDGLSGIYGAPELALPASP
jgi:ABC-type transport system substrate-binding protein